MNTHHFITCCVHLHIDTNSISIYTPTHITMDFVIGLPHTNSGYNNVWVIVNCLTKFAHFLPYKSMYSYGMIANFYVKEIVNLYGAPIPIISDKDVRFTSRVWPCL